MRCRPIREIIRNQKLLHAPKTFRHLPVVNRGRIVGIVSARDALCSELAEFESDVLERELIAEILG